MADTQETLEICSMKLSRMVKQLDNLCQRLDRLTELLMLLPEQQAATYIIMKREAEDAARRGQKPTDIWEVTIPRRAMQEEGRKWTYRG